MSDSVRYDLLQRAEFGVARLAPADRAEIQDLNARFAWALDTQDFDALVQVFTPDTHYRALEREFDDRDALIASFRARTGPRTTRHGLGNLLLTTDGPDVALGLGSWHTFAAHANHTESEPPSVQLYMVADFRDRYVRTRDGWRIAERSISPVFREAGLAPGAGSSESE